MNLRNRRVFCMISYCALMVLFVTYLLFSNWIIVSFDKSLNKVKKVDQSDFQELAISKNNADSSSLGYYYLACQDPIEDSSERVTISGFAACPTDIDNSDKYVDVLLVGERHIYKIRAVQEWSGRNEAYVKHHIQGYTNNITVTFPTIILKDDVYHIGLYIHENENDSGYISTSCICEKTSNGFFWRPIEKLKDYEAQFISYEFIESDLQVTVKNTSTVNWNSQNMIRCSIRLNGDDAGIRAVLSPVDIIKPGESVVFCFSGVTSADYSHDLVEVQMLQEGFTFFGDTMEITWPE